MKKVSMLVFVLMLFSSVSSAAFAAGNGDNKGKATAPGQSVNFSKGVTTIVTTTETVEHDSEIDVQESTEYSDVPMSETLAPVTLEPVETITIEESKEFCNNGHKQENCEIKHKYRTIITEDTITTTNTWVETTAITTTTTTVTPVTTTVTTVTTTQHQGAPGSNGKFIGETSTSTSVAVKGDPVTTSTQETNITNGPVSSTSVTTTMTLSNTVSGWK